LSFLFLFRPGIFGIPVLLKRGILSGEPESFDDLSSNSELLFWSPPLAMPLLLCWELGAYDACFLARIVY